MEEVIREQYNKLPDILKQHVRSAILVENIEEILKDHPLQQVQKNAFGVEVMLVLLQLESVEEFTVNIKHNMEIAMKRAEEISKKTKRLIFLPVQEHLIQRAYVEEEENNSRTDDIVAPTPQTPKQKRQIDHQIPLVEINRKKSEPKQDRPIVAPTPPETKPTAQEQVLQTPSVREVKSDDIFKKRLQQSVHVPVEKNKMKENSERVTNVSPSSKEQIANDPYKETID